MHTGPSDGEDYLIEISSSLVFLGCVKLTKTYQHTFYDLINS